MVAFHLKMFKNAKIKKLRSVAEKKEEGPEADKRILWRKKECLYGLKKCPGEGYDICLQGSTEEKRKFQVTLDTENQCRSQGAWYVLLRIYGET